MSNNGTARVRQRSRAIDLTQQEGLVTVHRALYGSEHDRQESVRVPVFHTDPARVRVEGSITKNLGDYNSARVAVTVELPCYPEESEIRRAYEFGSSLVDNYLAEELDAATGGGENGGSA